MESMHRQPEAEITVARAADRSNDVGRVRCRCLTCGAHVQAVAGVNLYGQCSNCGGVDLLPLAPLPSR